MDRKYWVDKWQNEKVFVLDKDKLKEKSYIFSTFPKTNLLGFQAGKVRHILCGDVLARYQRMCSKNVLFPTGCHSLCNTSFIESKKHSNVLNDDISKIYMNQMLSLGVGINEQKYIDMRKSAYLANLQQAFLDLYSKGYIKYKEIKVYYDKKNNKIYDMCLGERKLPTIYHNCFILKLEKVMNEVLNDIQELSVDDVIKEQLINIFKPQKCLKINLNLSNGSELYIQMEEPQYLGGISFIFLNPDYINITDYVDINEYNSICNYLEGNNSNAMFAFSGVYAQNPLTGGEIPIFISTLFSQPIYLGIPDVDEDDRELALQGELEIIPILEDGVLIHSDFLNGMEPAFARERIISSFVEAELATIEKTYANDEINLSSLDNFGPLFPFLEDKETGEIFSLEGHLPYAFSSKLRPTLPDNVDIVGDTMNGTINNMFTEGMCPLLAMVYDDIGSIFSIFSKESIKEIKVWKGMDYISLQKDEIPSSIFMPLALYRILSLETGIVLPKLFNKIDIFERTIDISRNEIRRSNNNLIDFDNLLDDYSSDAIRIFLLSSDIDEAFIFNYYQLDDIENLVKTLFEKLQNPTKENSMIDFQLFNLAKETKEFLDNKNILEYIKKIMEFTEKYVLIDGLSKKQIFTYIKLIFPIFPFLAEEINESIFNNKYSLMNEDWPN